MSKWKTIGITRIMLHPKNNPRKNKPENLLYWMNGSFVLLVGKINF